MGISEQLKKLRDISASFDRGIPNPICQILNGAADTIEALSAKLQAANMEQITENKQDDYKHCEECGNFAPLPNGVRGGKRGHCKIRHRIDARSGRLRACKLFVEKKGQTVEDCGGGWVPCKERLPEEKINPVTDDFYEYEVTFKQGDVIDIRHYKFGRGHWWNYGMLSDDCVIAWREHLEPYHEP